MLSLQDIRINGEIADGSSIPIIGGFDPIFTWEFSEDVAAPSQFLLEMRISTSDTDLGTDDFSGSIFSDTIESTANSFQYSSKNLSRGTVYYGQLRIKDPDLDPTAWRTVAFQINQIPFVTGYSISPSSPTADQNLELIYTFHDPDDHSESGTKIRWYKNNILQTSYNDLCTLPSSAIQSGDSWTAKIIPSDSIEYGPVVETQAVVVQDIDVSFDEVSILPLDANVDDILKAEYNLLDNEYVSFNGTIEIEWYLNEVAVPDSNNQYMRIKTVPGDEVFVVVRLLDSETIISQKRSKSVVISDVDWHIYGLEISGLTDTDSINDTEPILEWQVHKTTAEPDDKPAYFQIKITKTPSLDGPIFDTDVLEYTKSSYSIASGILERGNLYYFHIGVGDETTISDDQFLSKEVRISGSSWSENVSNATGWTIETKAQLTSTDADTTDDSNVGMYIHDGTYFCAVTFANRYVRFLSTTSTTYEYSDAEPPLRSPKTFKICGQGKNIRIFMNNKLIIDGVGILNNPSNLKFIEYGDIDTKNTNSGTFRFVRYSTKGAYGLNASVPDNNVFYFSEVGKIDGGSIEHISENLISWLPEDSNESAKLFKFNENSRFVRLPTATRNYSPITSIFISENRNKYIGTANGVCAIYGEKHDPDYSFSTSGTDVEILSKDFDRISTVSNSKLDNAEPDVKNNWFTIDTTYSGIGETIPDSGTGAEYDPYVAGGIKVHAIHYYSQRVHGHSWFDNVDNSKGWRVSMSIDIDNIEADDYIDQNIDRHGFGIYINDGTYQEIVYLYEDRIRLYYANVYVPINTKIEREYIFVGKDKNIYIYQRIANSNTPYFLLLDGSGLFTTPASKTANSRNPKIVIDKNGNHHTVWHDDSNKRSQIFYSKNDGQGWSTPEIVSIANQFSLRNPDIDVDESGKIWVTYEDTSWGPTEIVVSVRDSAGWNPKTRITNNTSLKGRPAIKVDEDQNVHVVWEDARNGLWQIFWAEWQDTKKAWISSAQFGSDTPVVMIHASSVYGEEDTSDPYTTTLETGAIDFRNPKLSLADNKLWLVCEGFVVAENKSDIYCGFRDLENKFWQSNGVPILDEDGNFVSFGTSTLITETTRYCVNPSVSARTGQQKVVIAWEDQSSPTSQIWSAVLNTDSQIIQSATPITNQLESCSNPSVGWAGNYALILFEKNGSILLSYYDSVFSQYHSSSNSGNDRVINIDSNKKCGHPSLPQYTPSQAVRLVYDFRKDRDANDISTIEFPDFYFVGDAFIEHIQASTLSIVTTTVTVENGTVNSLDTKEFAFGDFSENVGMLAHWKDIEMYFGYNARPHSIVKFNTDTVIKWPDNRVNDLFVDVYGNIIAATFGGLIYHNVYTTQSTNIDGHTADFNPSNLCTEETCLLKDKLITSVKWGKNGIWYVGTTTGLFYSKDAGRTWSKLFAEQLGDKIINTITVDKDGRAVIAGHKPSTDNMDGIFIAHPSMASPIFIKTPNTIIKTIAIDENNIIWAGSDTGLYRIDNFSSDNILTFGRSQGMRSSHVNDIAIVNKHLRYVATASGIERMNGIKFTNFNVHTHSLLNDNIASIKWDGLTNSLWVGALHTLHEIVFRDPFHDIIENEIVHYDSSEISTDDIYDKNLYLVLDYDEIQSNPDLMLNISPESTKVYINRNPIDFGYSVDKIGQSISFLTNLLPEDQIELEVSNRFIKEHDFNQSNIEKTVVGDKRRNIEKFDRTSKNQLLLLSSLDKPEILLDAGQSRFPFTTLMIDRDPPIGCIEKLDTVTQNILRFRILAFDKFSGLDSMILSNYENFTSDGDTPLDFKPFEITTDHNIGSGLTSTFTSLAFPSEVTINGSTYSVGTGSVIGKWFDVENNKEFLYVATSSPVVVFRYDPTEDEWTGIQALGSSDPLMESNNLVVINNVIWITTGSDGGNGGIYKSVDGNSFTLVGSVTGAHARGIAYNVDGTVYFGSSDAKIYSYRNNFLSVKYQNIGQTIYSLASFGNTLIAATGSNGRIYLIDLETDDNIIVFDGSESYIKDIFIKDADVITTTDQAQVYASSGTKTAIYRCNLSDFGFHKSFSSYGKNVNKIKSVESSILVDPTDASGITGNTVIAAIGTDIFKHSVPSWEFLYKHDEEIRDMQQFFSNGIAGVWIVSDDKVVKWTAVRNTKTVFLRLKDKAGNYSSQPLLGDEYTCPTDSQSICCNYTYSINIRDLQGFINESRIVDVNEYGEIQFTYDSPNERPFFSADQIDEEVGIYVSEIFNGSNGLVSWKSITWDSTEPEGTSVYIQIRSGITEDSVSEEDWSANLEKNDFDLVSLEHITNQYLQFRVILTSRVRDLSPTLTSVTIRNITAQASHFFTTNFVLPSRPIKGLLTANTFIPVSADIVFGINTKNSVDFGDYQIIEANRLFTTTQSQFGSNLRIGAKLLTPGITEITASNNPGDPYDESSYVCDIAFAFENINADGSYHFRVRFYNDVTRTQLMHTFFSGNDQTGWSIGGSDNIFPATGVAISSNSSAAVTFTPGTLVETNQKWYIVIDAYDGANFETVSENKSYICSLCNLVNEAGLVASYYGGLESLVEIPDLSSMTPVKVVIDSDINFPFRPDSWVTTDGTVLGDLFISQFAAKWVGRIHAPTTGEYKFYLTSDDGSRLYIDAKEVVDHDGSRDALVAGEGTVTLTEGLHDIKVEYFANLGNNGIKLEWLLPGEINKSVVPASRLFHTVTTEYCDETNVPKILNLAVLFELENGENVKINL